MLHIRAMRPDEVTALIDLWVEAWRATMPAIDFDARRGWIAAVLSDPAHDTFIAERNAPIGFATLQGRLLHQLVVAPAARGGGVAVALLDTAKNRAPGGLELEVNRDNPRAVAFYRREGFEEIGGGINPNSRLPTLVMAWRSDR